MRAIEARQSSEFASVKINYQKQRHAVIKDDASGEIVAKFKPAWDPLSMYMRGQDGLGMLDDIREDGVLEEQQVKQVGLVEQQQQQQQDSKVCVLL